MFGWRGRVGAVNPAAVAENLVLEFYSLAPEGMSFAVRTLGVQHFADYREVGLRESIMEAVDVVAARGVDCLVITGMPFFNNLGLAGETKMLQDIGEKTGIPTFTTQSAAVAAMRALGVRDVAVAAPYDAETFAGMVRYLEECGFTAGGRELGSEIPQLHRLTESDVYRHLRDTAKQRPAADALFVPGAQFPIPPVHVMEGDFGVPVVYATHAVVWMACHLLGIRDVSFEGKGALLESRLVTPASGTS